MENYWFVLSETDNFHGFTWHDSFLIYMWKLNYYCPGNENRAEKRK